MQVPLCCRAFIFVPFEERKYSIELDMQHQSNQFGNSFSIKRTEILDPKRKQRKKK